MLPLGHVLSRGIPRTRVTTFLSGVWASRARVVREVSLPPGARVVGVSGPTLGGSYKTPLVTALAQALHERGDPVAVVSHGYGARLGRPRVVAASDAVRDVGDDALATCRALAGAGVPVVVGAKRSEALALAASLARVVIVDGLLQAAPERLALAVLVTSRERPWGAGRCPPEGDLRAPASALEAAADLVVSVSSGDPPASAEVPIAGALPATFSLTGARTFSGEPVPLVALQGRSVGLVLAIARPERVLAALAASGIVPVVTRAFADHGTPGPVRPRPSVVPAIWLTTPKCATKLGARYEHADVLTLESRLDLPEELVRRARGETLAPPF